MKVIELYPSRNRLLFSVGFGLALMAVGRGLWLALGTQRADPSIAWVWPGFFFVVGGWVGLRALLWLVRPRPCFSCDVEGFSVMGGKRRSWRELDTVTVRELSVGFLPAARWVSLTLRKGETGRAGRREIPWTHLPASARETARRIEKLAQATRGRRPPPPPTYDPYDPAALAHARARAS